MMSRAFWIALFIKNIIILDFNATFNILKGWVKLDKFYLLGLVEVWEDERLGAGIHFPMERDRR